MRLAIGMPIRAGFIHAGHTFTFFSFGAACAAEEGLQVVNFQALDQGERTLDSFVRQALESEVEVLFLVHPDYYLAPSARNSDVGSGVLRMIRTLRDEGAAAIAAAGPDALGKLGFRPLKDAKPELGKIFEVDRLGHGMMAIDIEWLREHWPNPPWFAPRFKEGPDLAVVRDDWTFSEGVIARSGKLLCDGRLWLARVQVRFLGAQVDAPEEADGEEADGEKAEADGEKTAEPTA